MTRSWRLRSTTPRAGTSPRARLRSVKAGDFLTSPEVSTAFGETLAVFVEERAPPAGRPSGLHPGRRRAPARVRCSALLLATVDGPVETWAVEASPAARRALEAVVPGQRGGFTRATAAWVSRCGDRQRVARQPPQRHGGADAGRLGGATGGGGRRDPGGDVRTRPGRGGVMGGPLLRPGSSRLGRRGATGGGGMAGCGVANARRWRRGGDRLRRQRRGLGAAPCPGHHPDVSRPPHRPRPARRARGIPISRRTSTSRPWSPWPRTPVPSVEVHRQDDFLAGLGLRCRLSELRHLELELARSDDALERLRRPVSPHRGGNPPPPTRAGRLQGDGCPHMSVATREPADGSRRPMGMRRLAIVLALRLRRSPHAVAGTSPGLL